MSQISRIYPRNEPLLDGVGDPDFISNDPCHNCKMLFCDDGSKECGFIQIERNRIAIRRSKKKAKDEYWKADYQRRKQYHQDRYKQKKEQAERMLRELDEKLNAYIRDGSNAEWIDEQKQIYLNQVCHYPKKEKLNGQVMLNPNIIHQGLMA